MSLLERIVGAAALFAWCIIFLVSGCATSLGTARGQRIGHVAQACAVAGAGLCTSIVADACPMASLTSGGWDAFLSCALEQAADCAAQEGARCASEVATTAAAEYGITKSALTIGPAEPAGHGARTKATACLKGGPFRAKCTSEPRCREALGECVTDALLVRPDGEVTQ